MMSKIRRFNVDYRDKNRKYYNIELLMEVSLDKKIFSNESIANSIINDFRTTDFTVAIVLEIINGYTAEKLKTLPTHEMSKHLKLLYMNPDDKDDYLKADRQIKYQPQ